MEHVAIMRKSWGLVPLILSGQKTIESRWYKNKSVPWNKIRPEETIYFKNSGEPITVKARVDKVLQFENLTPEKIYTLRKKYAKEIGLTKNDLDGFKDFFEGKRYGLLVFLKDVEKVEPFNIDKTGFGLMSAWITLDSIDKLVK